MHFYGILSAPIFCSGEENALFLCYLGQICIIFGANLTSYLNIIILKLHLPKVLFGPKGKNRIIFDAQLADY